MQFNSDQTGFIPGRYSFCNVRKILNILYADYNNKEGAILSLDARKAFDTIEWPYLFTTLEKFGFSNSFIDWVRILYKSPKSSILTNGNKSKPFSLQRGVRQGDPLSPLLFDIALEPLAIGIRAHPNIKGIKLGKTETRVTLYADDLLICLADPRTSIPALLDYVNSFSIISGYTINWGKSEFMPLGDNLPQEFLDALPFKVAHEYFNYLGLKLTNNSAHLFKANFADLVDKLKANINAWRTLPLTMIGRVNAIKMVSLPRFLYLFQNLPIYLSTSFFKKLDSIILPFVWGYKSHRISKAHLYKSTNEGGLGLPNIKHYYWAANSRALTYWKHSPTEEAQEGTPSWLQLETPVTGNNDILLCAWLFSNPTLDKSTQKGFVLNNSLRILRQIKVANKLPKDSVYVPICQNPFFKPGQLDGTFAIWKRKGIATLADLYIDGCFASFAQLRNKYDIPNSHFFRYLQIRHYVKQRFDHFETIPNSHPFYDNLLLAPDSKHLITKFVECFASSVSSEFLRQAWAKDLHSDVPAQLWEKALALVHSCSINTRYRLIQYKVIHRLHYSKTKLNRIFPSISPQCDVFFC